MLRTHLLLDDPKMNVMLRWTIALAPLLAVALSGCGKSGPQIAPVHGVVKLDGQPLENADVEFQPDGAPRPSTGRTNADGRYDLAYKRGQLGAVVGQNTVRITVSHELVKNPPNIAAKFNARSELKADVKPGDNEFNFDVTTEGK